MTTIYRIYPTYIEMVTSSKDHCILVSDSNDNLLYILHSIKRDFLFYLSEKCNSNFARYRNLLFALDILTDIVRTSNVRQSYVIKMLVILLSFLNRYSFNNFQFQIFNKHE